MTEQVPGEVQATQYELAFSLFAGASWSPVETDYYQLCRHCKLQVLSLCSEFEILVFPHHNCHLSRAKELYSTVYLPPTFADGPDSMAAGTSPNQSPFEFPQKGMQRPLVLVTTVEFGPGVSAQIELRQGDSALVSSLFLKTTVPSFTCRSWCVNLGTNIHWGLPRSWQWANCIAHNPLCDRDP